MTRLHPQSCRATAGFTLLEVVTALALLAFSMAALWKGLGQATVVTQQVPERIVARWIAQNHVVMRQARNDWPALRTYSGVEQMNGRQWYWQEIIEQTEEPLMRRVTVNVALEKKGTPLFTLEAYLARPKRHVAAR